MGIDLFPTIELCSETGLFILLPRTNHIQLTLSSLQCLVYGLLSLAEFVQTGLSLVVGCLLLMEQFMGDMTVLVPPGLDWTIHFYTQTIIYLSRE